jgi:ribosome-associated heat shock protein Hsp15
MDEVRLDKWLWAARFFKTRPLAQKAIEGGKVKIDGSRAKPGKALHVGQPLEIRCGVERFEVTVRALADRRGPASAARALYEESDESRQRREQEARERKAAESSTPAVGGRPDKQQRRRIRELLERNR